jgi:predicted naringenin-chalcone synthase
MSRIISIGTAVPRFGATQNCILDFMHDAYAEAEASRKLNILFSRSGIGTRYSSLPDFMHTGGERSLFNRDRELPKVEERLDIFKENALPLAIAAIQNSIEKIGTTIADFKPTHLITVTCTGLYAPGIDTELITTLGLPRDIFRTGVNFIGCNAAFHALKIADLIARVQDDARVLVVCVELCTLHFQPKNNNDNLLSNTIFGDGAAAAIITSESFATEHGYKGLTIDGFYSVLFDNAKELMSWDITPVNFEMVLDTELPDFIGSVTSAIVKKAGETLRFSPEKISKWAIHPGGKKILDIFKKNMQLTDENLRFSYAVLNEYGNMSSPTVLFVINEILKSQPDPGENIFSVGFGPGITIDSALLTYVS